MPPSQPQLPLCTSLEGHPKTHVAPTCGGGFRIWANPKHEVDREDLVSFPQMPEAWREPRAQQ